MEKLNRAQKCSILGPQNLGSRGGPPGSAPAQHVIWNSIVVQIKVEFKFIELGHAKDTLALDTVVDSKWDN